MDYYCNFDAASDGDGSLSSPWNAHASINVSAISADTDTVRRIYLSGTQTTQWAITSAQLTGVAGRVIEVRGDGVLGAYDGVGTGNDKGVISTIGNDYLKFYGLTVHGNNQALGDGQGLHIDTGDNITVDNCIAYDNYIYGIVISDCTNSVIEKCTAHSNYVKGLAIVGITGATGVNTDNVIIRNCTTYNNGRYGIQIVGDGDDATIDINSEAYGNTSHEDGNGIQIEHCNNARVYSNSITNAGDNTIVDPGGINPGNGIILEGQVTNSRIHSNNIIDAGNNSIDFRVDTQSPASTKVYRNFSDEPGRHHVNLYITGMADIEVFSNYFRYDAIGVAIQFACDLNVVTGNSFVSGNTFVNGNQHITVTAPGASGWTASNNIHNNATRCINCGGSAAITLLNNCYYQVAGGILVRSGGTTYTAGTISGIDANAITTDPLVTDPANGDFTLTTGSPCIGTGIVWWSGGNPESYNDVFPSWDIDLGGYQSTDAIRAPFHPLNL